jgi:hypothetical protein
MNHAVLELDVDNEGFAIERVDDTATVYREVPDPELLIGTLTHDETTHVWVPAGDGFSPAVLKRCADALRDVERIAPQPSGAQRIEGGYLRGECSQCGPNVPSREKKVVVRAVRRGEGPGTLKRARQCAKGHWVLFEVVDNRTPPSR